MAADSTKKLTEGNPLTLILGFSIPMLAGLLFQQMYSLVDTIIVGQTLGDSALAAVGSTGSINFLINGFCIGVCSGFAIPVAQRFGAESYDSMRKFVGNSIILSVIFSVVLTTVISIFCYNILSIMQTPDDIIDLAYAYISIIFFGIPVTFLYNLTAGIMRSLGDSKTPTYFLIMAAGINIVLDIVFIVGLKMNVEGPALATVISQLIAGLSCLIYMRKKFPILKMEKTDMVLGKHHTQVLIAMGIPFGLQYSITAIGSVILQTAVNGLGTIAVASMTAGVKVSMFVVCPFDALGGTMATYAGQNVGAKNITRVKKGVWTAQLLGTIYAVIIFIILFFSGRYILRLFTATDIVIEQAMMFLLANAITYTLLAAVNIFRFAIQGMGFSTFAIYSGVMEMIARILVAFTFVPMIGYAGAIWASPIAWLFAVFFLIPGFYYCCKKLDKKFGEDGFHHF
ncbi:MATE family efflux transporter [Pseudobutyrivibrio xylanivorans]|uniref:Putative efflux protein, MATE family n=1 Tax=Pseudobutyrivibrio xylanivorans TaxID=185007 RepID=A0A1G5RRC0_PSEXY|nr:MATE family efflux transporter [Pseudobutyrivibrio xylanivorans]SCZ76612.1 putative efflux protein, MATE family [Pseudobutyrivibrio xylanivorans]